MTVMTVMKGDRPFAPGFGVFPAASMLLTRS